LAPLTAGMTDPKLCKGHNPRPHTKAGFAFRAITGRSATLNARSFAVSGVSLLPIYATAVAYFFYAPWCYLLLGAILLCHRKDVNKTTAPSSGRA
jgi:hypothetical protein